MFDDDYCAKVDKWIKDRPTPNWGEPSVGISVGVMKELIGLEPKTWAQSHCAADGKYYSHSGDGQWAPQLENNYYLEDGENVIARLTESADRFYGRNKHKESTNGK